MRSGRSSLLPAESIPREEPSGRASPWNPPSLLIKIHFAFNKASLGLLHPVGNEPDLCPLP